MPHLFRSWPPEPNLSPKEILERRGPIIQVTVSLPPQIAEALLKEGKEVPSPITGPALIDTGATGSAIDDEAAKKLGLPVINVVNVMTPSHSEHPCNIYPARIGVVGASWMLDLSCTGTKIGAQGLLMLLGRDMLKDAQLVYNGTLGFFTISY